MKSRSYTCIVCGAKGVDRSPAGGRLYCSSTCSKEHYRRNNGIGVVASPGCLFNDGVACDERRCYNCGWYPSVEARRKEALT